MDLLLKIDGDKSHYVYIKNFNRFRFHKTKNKNKKYFCKSCLQCFSSKNVLTKHKKDCLSINGLQSVKLGREATEFKNYFKQIPAPFKKIMLILSLIQKVLKFMKALTQRNIKISILVDLPTKLFVLMINLVSQLLFLKAKMLLMNLLKQYLGSMNIVKK